MNVYWRSMVECVGAVVNQTAQYTFTTSRMLVGGILYRVMSESCAKDVTGLLRNYSDSAVGAQTPL